MSTPGFDSGSNELTCPGLELIILWLEPLFKAFKTRTEAFLQTTKRRQVQKFARSYPATLNRRGHFPENSCLVAVPPLVAQVNGGI